jgi:hypothetical protein
MIRLFAAAIVTVFVTAVLFVCLAWLTAPMTVICSGGGMTEEEHNTVFNGDGTGNKVVEVTNEHR